MSTVPEKFHAVDHHLARWALPNQVARVEARLASTIEELDELHRDVMPLLQEIVETLGSYPLADIPEELVPYGHLALMIADTDFAVNRVRQPEIPFAIDLRTMEPIVTDPDFLWN
ncbi:MAG: hypothetical protein J4A00_04995 [Gammaproteobacteria bacterium]|nr:hypothetical protein [Gammaproteobacteria bacterium]